MLHIKKWSIRARVLLAFLAILAPFVGFAAIAALHFGTLMHTHLRTQEEASVDLMRTSDAMAAADGLMLSVEAYVASDDQQEQQQVSGYLTRLREAFRMLHTTPLKGDEELTMESPVADGRGARFTMRLPSASQADRVEDQV